MEGFGFEQALIYLKNGQRVRRSGWATGLKFMVMMPALQLPPHSQQEPGPKVNDRTAKFIGEDTPLDSQPYFAAFTSNGKWYPGFNPLTADILALDWMLVE